MLLVFLVFPCCRRFSQKPGQVAQTGGRGTWLSGVVEILSGADISIRSSQTRTARISARAGQECGWSCLWTASSGLTRSPSGSVATIQTSVGLTARAAGTGLPEARPGAAGKPKKYGCKPLKLNMLTALCGRSHRPDRHAGSADFQSISRFQILVNHCVTWLALDLHFTEIAPKHLSGR